jgi:hypothetical protein
MRVGRCELGAGSWGGGVGSPAPRPLALRATTVRPPTSVLRSSSFRLRSLSYGGQDGRHAALRPLRFAPCERALRSHGPSTHLVRSEGRAPRVRDWTVSPAPAGLVSLGPPIHRPPNAEGRRPPARPAPRAPSSELRAPSYELRAPNSELRATSSELRATSYELRTPSYELRTPSSDPCPSAFSASSAVNPCLDGGRKSPLLQPWSLTETRSSRSSNRGHR